MDLYGYSVRLLPQCRCTVICIRCICNAITALQHLWSNTLTSLPDDDNAGRYHRSIPSAVHTDELLKHRPSSAQDYARRARCEVDLLTSVRTYEPARFEAELVNVAGDLSFEHVAGAARGAQLWKFHEAVTLVVCFWISDRSCVVHESWGWLSRLCLFGQSRVRNRAAKTNELCAHGM